MSLNQAFLIKGWLLGEHPPEEVMEAIEAVIEGLKGREPVIVSGDVRVALTQEELSAAMMNAIPPMPRVNQPAETPVPMQPDDTPAPKKRRKWSPEARAAAADRMRARQAAGLMAKKEPTEPGEAEAPPL